jgi:restriction system protein
MIPDYQTLMLPFLKIISDDKVYTTSQIIPVLAAQFQLTDKELNELSPAKRHKVFNNRVHWVKAQLTMYGLIDNEFKNAFKISNRGKQVLQENPVTINNQYLRDRFKNVQAEDSFNDVTIDPLEDKHTPKELIEKGYKKTRTTLEHEILSTLKSIHPRRFEQIVVELLVKMGYGGTEESEVTDYTKDEGIDGIIKEDKLGLDVIYIQAKRWEGTVGSPELHKFVGALAGQGAKKGIFITTSSFTKDALKYIPKNEAKIVLIDGERLASLMIDYNLGVSVQNIYEIKKIDSDYFEEE